MSEADTLSDTSPAMGGNRPLLQISNIEVIYDHVILVLRGVSLTIPKGGIVALLGANGAGKSTTLKAISGLLESERGEVTKGSIEYEGKSINDISASKLVSRGLIQVMEGRHCFEHLSVEDPPRISVVAGFTPGTPLIRTPRPPLCASR